jgi:hypothetical protein
VLEGLYWGPGECWGGLTTGGNGWHYGLNAIEGGARLRGGEIKVGALWLRLGVFEAWSCGARRPKVVRFGGSVAIARVMWEEGDHRWGPLVSRARRGAKAAWGWGVSLRRKRKLGGAPQACGPVGLMERGGGPGWSGPAWEV